MAANSNAIEQAVSRTLRDNLSKIQRTSDDLHQAITDLVSACASSRPANTLPPMLRAQTSAAALSASLEVLSRFVTAAMQAPMQLPAEAQAHFASEPAGSEPALSESEQISQPEPQQYSAPQYSAPVAESAPSHSAAENAWSEPPPVISPEISTEAPVETAAEMPAQPEFSQPPEPNIEQGIESAASVEAPVAAPAEQQFASVAEELVNGEPVAPFVHHITADAENLPEPSDAQVAFNLSSLSADDQELHRRAYRVAKVSMQDIKMLRPEDVRLGRENRDLCFRLRDDIDKAYKEYDRRFKPILSHPVDYFYDWMVEILAGGDPQALGEYPYSSPLVRH